MTRLGWRLAMMGLALATIGLPMTVAAQESRLAAEFRREGEHLKETCASPRTLMSCAMTVVTGHPVHLSFGSLAPGNGMALGASFSTSHAPSESWRLSWSGDAVRTFGGSWRAGAYMKLIHTPESIIIVVADPGAGTAAADMAVRPHTVINLYGQTTSLQDVSFFPLGESPGRNGRASFGMQQTVIGAGVIAPLSGSRLTRVLNLSLVGEVNGRLVSIRNGAADDVPGILAAYSDADAPGLDEQPDALQFGGGVRLKPVPSRYFRMNYLVTAQQFLAGDTFSFRRWRVDFDHEIALYGTSRPVESRDTNTPNDCLTGPGADSCPAISRDRRGSINLRLLAVTSSAGGQARVPFYFQPTIGGSDINGQAALASFDDYRFRGPHLLLLQQAFEHSVWGPIGAWVRTDQGIVTATRDALGFASLRTTVAAGVTIRAGGFPMVVASYAVGGGEGRHFSFTINTSLLGGSSRPSLD